ncbi:sorting nexin lst-4 isoform X2 [Patella vulgata]|uniref:sorting nexin lst-4 isoform X2 n=1 Tax=Patella vulgata TaxID=6465 RepID=UPI0021802477|nr:sorting nexin lst-4 isoform X2 [Patella vulgata]
MAAVQAKGLYQFDGDSTNGEISFEPDEILTIVRQDIGEGWWEARRENGDQGLIPETYVELLSIPEPQFPPPPPPNLPSIPNNLPLGVTAHNPVNNANHGLGNREASYDEWDDEWEDDDDQSSNSTDNQSGAPTSTGSQNESHGQGNFGLSVPKRERKQVSPTSDMSKYGTVKSSFNRFSHFAKLGGEAFMMGQVNADVPESDLIKIIETENGPDWTPLQSPYTCTISSPKKATKMKGLKSFITYHLTPSFSNIQVSRRYKHFDWLHLRLMEKFVCIPVPPLPCKQISGRYEEDFIQERMRHLQQWLDRMVRHPVIAHSEVMLHFLTCTNEKKWTEGKRKAEKDPYVGGKFFLVLQIPPHACDMKDVESQMEVFCRFVMNMNENCKTLVATNNDFSKKHMGPFKREFQKIGSSYRGLARTFNDDNVPYSRDLTAAIDYMGEAYMMIGDMFEKQPPKDLHPLIDSIIEYRGILQTYPDVLKVHEGAVGKAKECLKSQEEGKLSESEVQSVLQRADTISYGTLAEMHNFHHERVKDFKDMMQKYLKEQIEFYKGITSKLEASLAMFEKA